MLFLCLIGGLVYALALYFKNKNFDEKSNGLKYLMSFLRFSLVSLLLALLLNPFLQSLITEVKDPVIALVRDNSQSVSAWLSDNESSYNQSILDLRQKLSEKFRIDDYALGTQISNIGANDSLSYSDELTNLSNIKSLTDQYEGENLSAIIIATDGIFNQGKSPVYANIPKNIPIYSIALGDTSKRRDGLIKNVYHNNIAYLNDITNMQVDIKANNCKGTLAKLLIEEENGGVYSKVKEEEVSINSDDYFKTIEVKIELKKPGIAHYRARLRGISNESVTANNVKDVFIEVLDARQKIRIIANGPHPDLSAIKTILLDNKNYEAEIEYMDDSPNPNEQSDMVIFHNLPSNKYNINNITTALKRKRTPQIFVVGAKTNFTSLNSVQDIVNITGGAQSSNDVQVEMNDNFSLFTISDELKASISNFPPLLAPFGEYKLGPSSTALMNQKIGSIDTDFPLFAYQNKGGLRSAIICAEGIWKWKLFDYLERQNFDIIKELVSKTVTYASIKEDKRKFRISTPDRIYTENADILFTAELYNDNYELLNDTEVELTILNESNEEFNYLFSKQNNYFTLDIGSLPPGRYTYKGTCNHNGTVHTDQGKITIQKIQYELYDLEANHSLLHALADQQNGKVYDPNQISDLALDLTQSDDMKPVMYQYAQNTSVIDFKWLFFILLGLLSVEWFLRRYNGSL